jgi:hypothetical protein
MAVISFCGFIEPAPMLRLTTWMSGLRCSNAAIIAS